MWLDLSAVLGPSDRIYASAQDKGHAALADKLPKNLGTAIGIEIRDNTHTLSATNEKVVKAGMTFNVALGKCTLPWLSRPTLQNGSCTQRFRIALPASSLMVFCT